MSIAKHQQLIKKLEIEEEIWLGIWKAETKWEPTQDEIFEDGFQEFMKKDFSDYEWDEIQKQEERQNVSEEDRIAENRHKLDPL